MVDARRVWLHFLLANPAGAFEARENSGSNSVTNTICFVNSVTNSLTHCFTSGCYQGDYHLREGQVREESDGFETEVPERV